MSREFFESQTLRLGQERIKDAMHNYCNKQEDRSFQDDDNCMMSFGDNNDGQQTKQTYKQHQDHGVEIDNNQIELQYTKQSKQKSQEFDAHNKSEIQMLNHMNASNLLDQTNDQEIFQAEKLNQIPKSVNDDQYILDNQNIESNSFIRQSIQFNRNKSKTDQGFLMKKVNYRDPQKQLNSNPLSELGEKVEQKNELKMSKVNFFTNNFNQVRRFIHKMKQSSQLHLFKNLKLSQFKMINDYSAKYEYFIYQKNLIIPEVINFNQQFNYNNIHTQVISLFY